MLQIETIFINQSRDGKNQASGHTQGVQNSLGIRLSICDGKPYRMDRNGRSIVHIRCCAKPSDGVYVLSWVGNRVGVTGRCGIN